MAFGISFGSPWKKPTTTSKPAYNPWDSANSFEQRSQAYAQSKAAAANAVPTMGPDAYNGANLLDILAGMNNGNTPRGGSGGGGGGYGGGGPSAMTTQAFAQMLQTLKDQQAANMKTFDTRDASLRTNMTDAGTRLTGIIGGLNDTAAATRGTVANSYAGSDAKLASLMQQFAADEAARTYGAGQTVSMFGGAPSMLDRNYGAVDTINAQRAMLGGQAGAADAMYANRGNVYNGLTGDVQFQNSQMFDALLAQLAAQKQQQQMTDQQAIAQLQLQAAGAGVKL